MESPLPKTGWEAVLQILWGTVVFALGFEGVVKTVEGELWAGAGCFLAALILAIGLVYRAKVIPAVRDRLSQFILGAVGLAGVILVIAAAVGLFALRGGPQASGNPALEKASYLKDVHLYSGSAGPIPLNPRFVAKCARNGPRARLYVEDRYYVGGLMGSSAWFRAPQVRLGEIKDFVVGDPVDIAILTPFENDGRKMWRWGPPTENP